VSEPVAPLALEQIKIVVRDMPRSLAFYRLLGVSINRQVSLSKGLDVAVRRRAKQPAILTAELGRTLVTHAEARLGGVEGFAQHEAPCFLQAKALLVLERAERRHFLENGDATPTNAASELFTKIGPAILVTHSQGGGPGWLTAIKNENVRAIVAYEPGSNFIFPEGEAPPPMPSAAGTLEGVPVPVSEFMRLTKIPIVIYFGDNIPENCRRRFRARTTGAFGWPWRGCGGMPSTAGAETSPWCTCRKGDSAGTPTFRSRT
jgi:hypothetical protein